jgi:hypothetical protein
MLDRRDMMTGLIVAPAIVRVSSLMPINILAARLTPSIAPAIVPLSSLMPLSPIRPTQRYMIRLRHVQGGSMTILGEAPMDTMDRASFLQFLSNKIPWLDWHLWTEGELHILREHESALPLLTNP